MSAKPSYNYGSSARKLRNSPEILAPHPFEVVPGRRDRAQVATASDAVMLFAKLLIAGIVIFALIGVVRISLSSATVALAIEAKTIDSQIEDARDSGSALEVEQSSLSNPTRIKDEAQAIGMSVPNQITYMDLSGDIVVMDKQGNLSLSKSVDELVEVNAASDLP